MKIVVLDGYTENPGDLSWEGLEQLGELTVYDRTSLTDEQETIDRIGDAEIVFTNKTPISRAVLDACPSVRFINVHGRCEYRTKQRNDCESRKNLSHHEAFSQCTPVHR